jgi:hypothetical protein
VAALSYYDLNENLMPGQVIEQAGNHTIFQLKMQLSHVTHEL